MSSCCLRQNDEVRVNPVITILSMKRFLLASLCLAASLLALVSSGRAADIRPLTRAHAHNDYAHKRPLRDALDQGFCSVEADIFLVESKLLVGHDRSDLRPDRTLQSLYLDPLAERVKSNGGLVFPNGPRFYLLIDFKTEAGPTWGQLKQVLTGYTNMLTGFQGVKVMTNAVTLVLSGNSPRSLLATDELRWAAIDGRVPDLELNPSPALVPWVSESWSSHFTWRGEGEMPADQLAKLKGYANQTHAQGRMLRLWGAPDNAVTWKVLYDSGVDLINTDRLAQLREFLQR